MKNRSKGIVISYINTAVNLICGLFLSSFLIRSLGDTEYGIYQTISSFASYLVLLEFGTGTVMTRNISVCIGKKQRKEEIDKNTSTICMITNFLTILIVLVSVVLYFSIESIYSHILTAEQIEYAKNIFIFIVIYLVVSFYVHMLSGVILAYEHYSYSAAVNIVKNILRTGILVASITNIRCSIIVAITDMALSICILIVSLIYSKRRFKLSLDIRKFDKDILKSTLPFCIAICMQAIVNQANSNVDKFIIGITVSPEAVSLYSISLYVYTMFLSVTTTPISIYSPQIAQNVSGGMSRDELSRVLITPCRLSVFIGGTVFFGFISAGRQFVSIVYGSEYLSAFIIAVIIMAPMFISMTNGVLINVLDVLNKRIVRSVVLIFTTVANIVMTVFFINFWGIVGAAIATAVCTFVGEVIVMNVYYVKKIKIRVMYLFFNAYKGVLIYQIAGAVMAFIAGCFIDNVYVSFITCGLIFVIVFLAGYLMFGANKEERNKIKKFLHIRQKK